MSQVGLFLLVFLISVSSSAIAQQSLNDLSNYLSSAFNVDALTTFLFPGLNPEWLKVPQVLWYVILPFIAVFTVIYGFFKELRIFRHAPNKVNIVLAFAMAMLLLPSGALTLIVTYLYAFSAAFAAIVFGVVFIIGVILWGIGTSWRWWGEASYERAYARQMSTMYKDLKTLRQERIRLVSKLGDAADENARQNIVKQIESIDARLKTADERLKTVKEYG